MLEDVVVADFSRILAGPFCTQVLADLGADAERRPRRAVPRLESDLALPDQLAVVGFDIALGEPDEALVRAALGEVLLDRAEIDGARPADDATEAVLGRAADADEVLRVLASSCPRRQPSSSPQRSR